MSDQAGSRVSFAIAWLQARQHSSCTKVAPEASDVGPRGRISKDGELTLCQTGVKNLSLPHTCHCNLGKLYVCGPDSSSA